MGAILGSAVGVKQWKSRPKKGEHPSTPGWIVA